MIETLKLLPKWMAIVVMSIAAIGASSLVVVAALDPDRSIKLGSVEISASQNSPMNKCKERLNWSQAKVASDDAELSRLSGRLAQEQDAVSKTRQAYLREGTASVANAQEEVDYDARHADPVSTPLIVYPSTEPAPKTLKGRNRPSSSYMLHDEIRDFDDLRTQYNYMKASRDEDSLESKQIVQECYVSQKPSA